MLFFSVTRITCFSRFEFCFLKHKQDIYFLTYKAIATAPLFFFNFFESSFSNGKYSFPVIIFIYKRFNFCYSFCIFFIFWWFNATVAVYWKHLLSFSLLGFIVAFLFFIQSGESIYNPPWFGFILWHCQ